MKRVVLYTRVSTDDQAKYGFSLKHQFNTLCKYCEARGWVIVKHFQDDHSAKNFNRPEFINLETFCKANKSQIDYVIVLRWDRFSRNLILALEKIERFKKLGIEINSMEQWIPFGSGDHKILLTIHLTTPEVENDKISQRTKEGINRAKLEGCWTSKAPFGYDNVRLGDKATLAPNQNAQMVVQIFEMLATGLYPTDFVRRKFSRKGLPLKKQAMLNLVKNKIYTGKIVVKPLNNDEEIRVVDGLHPAIISEDLFQRVQEIISPRNHLKGKLKIQHEEFPLRGHLKCRICGGKLTGSASTSRNKDKHFYYHCQKGCKERFRANDANDDFERLLKRLEFNSEVAELYMATIRDIFRERKVNKDAEMEKLINEIRDKKQLIEKVEDRYFSDAIDEEQYKNALNRYKAVIQDKQFEIEELKGVDADTLKHFNYCVSLLSNIAKHYEQSDVQVKSKIVGSIFSEKLVYAENKYRTTDANKFFLLFDTVKADLGMDKTKQADISVGLSTLAPEAGLEPATL